MSDKPSLRVVRTLLSLKGQVVESLRSAIGEGRFAPGDRLIERELCELLDVSRAVLREALSQLAAEGLVQIIPHRGPVVAACSADEARAIYELRATLEEMAARCFVERATPEEREVLEGAYQELLSAYDTKSPRDYLAVKTKFYAALTTGSHNTILEDVLRLINGRVTMLRSATISQPGRLAASAAELDDIMRAIRANDAHAAGLACRQHVMSAASLAAEILSETSNAKPANRGAAKTRHS